MALFPNHWYYNTESGQLTSGNNLENLGNNLFGGLGWHELNISGSATATQAAAEAKAEFPTGATPTNAGITPARVLKGAAGEAANALTGGGSSGASSTSCLITLPVLGGCLLTKTNVRAMVAGAGIVVFGVVGIVGLLILVAQAAQKTGAGHAAGGALETAGAALAVVPGAEGAGLALGAAGGAARRAGSGSSGAAASLSARRARRSSTAQETAAADQRERGTETVTVRDRTPLDGQMGGTRDSTRTVRRPGPRRESA